MNDPRVLNTLLNCTSFASLIDTHKLQQFQLNILQQEVIERVRNELICNIIQEKLTNQILVNAILLNEALKESQGNREEKCQQRVQESLNKGEQEVESKSEKNSTDHSQEKKNPILRKTIRNETKNIPKNYGKAIISFIQKNESLARKIVSSCQIDFVAFMVCLRHRKKNVNSIADLRALWLESENRFAKPTRILSNIFLKKHSLSYIFNSRVSNFPGHIKYRRRLMEAVERPHQFTSIKQF